MNAVPSILGESLLSGEGRLRIELGYLIGVDGMQNILWNPRCIGRRVPVDGIKHPYLRE